MATTNLNKKYTDSYRCNSIVTVSHFVNVAAAAVVVAAVPIGQLTNSANDFVIGIKYLVDTNVR